jgi:hypothetical protein
MDIPIKNVSWIKQPLICTWEPGHPRSVTFQGALTLLANGHVIINNRSFARRDPVDYVFHGGRAYRAHRSNILIIRCNGPSPEIYVFKYRSILYFFRKAWYRLIPRLH